MLNSITLPLDSPIIREFRKPLSSQNQELYALGKLGCYDTHTLFYDFFLSADRKEVIAIAPPYLNLKNLLSEVKIKLLPSGSFFPLNPLMTHKKVQILRAKLTEPLSINNSHNAEVHLNNGITYRIELSSPEILYKTAIVTIQKNNRIRWIKDWISYYKVALGVEHVFIYDNNSDYQKSLQDEVGNSATIIPWNFPYGVYSRSGNKFCQVGALNHFKYRYGSSCKAIFNFDIDELLRFEDLDIKNRAMTRSLLRYSGFSVPFIKPESHDYSFVDYKKRNIHPQSGGQKYSVPGNMAGVMDVHTFDPTPKWWHCLTPKSFIHGPVVDSDKASFLHYKGITLNWRQGNRLDTSIADNENTVDERGISDFFNSFKLKKDSPG